MTTHQDSKKTYRVWLRNGYRMQITATSPLDAAKNYPGSSPVVRVDALVDGRWVELLGVL